MSISSSWSAMRGMRGMASVIAVSCALVNANARCRYDLRGDKKNQSERIYKLYRVLGAAACEGCCGLAVAVSRRHLSLFCIAEIVSKIELQKYYDHEAHQKARTRQTTPTSWLSRRICRSHQI